METGPTNWPRLRELFDELAPLHAGAREQSLTDACEGDTDLERELRALLAAHDRELGHTGERFARLLQTGEEIVATSASPGERIGPWLLHEVIGRGGMGVVYRAERADGAVQQQVAVKVLSRMHLDDAGIRRFAQERDIVAQLAHPGIARLYDAGTTRDGFPYYAMELVEGERITAWSDSHGLDVRERVALFLKVCDAVRFAHAQLVLHRDIKPANLLVDAAGEPRLIDFGIATTLLAGDATQTGMQMFSPSNAAPEQVRGERCTVACDVYQLGTVLYELLAGTTVLRETDATPAQVEAAILARVPDRPSERVAKRDPARAKLLRGDLDTIVLRALRKEPAQRYASVEQLADELERWQRHEPIAARGGDRGYRFAKLVQRHRVAFAAAGIVVLIVAAFVSTLVLQAQRLADERDRARAISGFLVDVFASADPARTLDRNTSIGKVLDRGREQLGRTLGGRPELHAPMLATLAHVYANLQDSATAKQLADEAQVILASGVAIDDRARVESLMHIAYVRASVSNAGAAGALAGEALAIQERLGEPLAAQWPARQLRLSTTIARQERSTWKAPLLAELAAYETARDVDPLLLADVRNQVGNMLVFAGEYEIAERALRASLASLEGRVPHNDSLMMGARYGLGNALSNGGKPEEAVELFQGVVEDYVALFGKDSPALVRHTIRLAEALARAKRYDEALATATRARGIIAKNRTWPHGDYLVVEVTLGDINRRMHAWSDAERHFREAMRASDAMSGLRGNNSVEIRQGLGEALRELGRVDESLAVLEECVPYVDYTIAQHGAWAIQYAESLHAVHRDRDMLAVLDRMQPLFATYGKELADEAARAGALRREAVTTAEP